MSFRFKFLLILIFSLILIVNFVHAEEINSNLSLNREQALSLINQSELIILEMQSSNFTILYVNDSLKDAKRIFEIVSYAEILRSGNSSEKQKEEARRFLSLVDWSKTNYSDILPFIEDIKNRRDLAIDLSDSLFLFENNLNKYYSKGIALDKVSELLNQSKEAFYKDRYNESLTLLQKAADEFENQRAMLSTTSVIRNNTINFIKNNWIYILIVLFLIVLFIYSNYKTIKRKLLKNKIQNLKREKEIIVDLIKKAQDDRFNKNTLSSLVYNIRVKKYEERLNNIKQELPFLEKKLNGH